MANDQLEDGGMLKEAQKKMVASIVQAYLEKRVDDRVDRELRGIRSLARVLGFTNLVALLGGLAYVFALLPGQIQGQVVQSLEFVSFKDDLNQRIGKANAYIEQAEGAIARLKETHVNEVADRLGQIERLFNDNPTADLALRAEIDWKPRVEELERRMDGLDKKVVAIEVDRETDTGALDEAVRVARDAAAEVGGLQVTVEANDARLSADVLAAAEAADQALFNLHQLEGATQEHEVLQGRIATRLSKMAELNRSIDSRLVAHDEWLFGLQEASDDSSLTAALAYANPLPFSALIKSLIKLDDDMALNESLRGGMSIRAIERAAARALPLQSEVLHDPEFKKEARDAVETLFLTLKTNKYVTVRIAATRALGDFPDPNDPRIMKVLLPMLEDKDWRIRRSAALALGERGSKLSDDMRSEIISALQTVGPKENTEVRRAATDSLRLLGR